MKPLICIFTLVLSLAVNANSLLDQNVNISEFGNIRFRAPINVNKKNPIILFHGIYGGASHRTWRQLLSKLDHAGERVYIMDLPGVGESDKPKRAYSIEDFDKFVENFLVEVVQERATLVSESVLSNAVLRVSADRPDLVRRVVILNPSGVYSLIEKPNARKQALYYKLYSDSVAASAFYRNLLNPNSLRYFLRFGFFDGSLVNDKLLKDFIVLRENIDQRFLTISFVGGQIYRSFKESSRDVFIPVLAIFGKEYEAFQDNKIEKAKDFKAIRPYFEYLEIKNSGSSVQREKPEIVAKKIIDFTIMD
jgi:pimeloyl-ACP methyl ester carboxylesterase